MNKMFKTLAGAAAIALAAIGFQPSSAQESIKVGIRGGIDEQIFEVVGKVADRSGLKIEPVVINGTISPNEALSNGDIDANSFQHIPFLNVEIKKRGYDIVAVAKTYVSPMAYYSAKYKSLQDLPAGARIGIPSDVSNQTRALLLLETSGLIKLKPGLDASRDAISVTDIVDNPRKLEFVEMAIVVLSKTYRDLDAAAIVNSFASQVGLLAARDGILVERGETSPYANIIVVRPQDKDKPWVGKLIRAYQSDEVRSFIRTEFAGSLLPLF